MADRGDIGFDILNAPSSDVRSKLYGFRIPSGFNARPPGRLAYRYDPKNLGKPDKALI